MKKFITPELIILIILDVTLGLLQVAIPIMINYTTVSVPSWVQKSLWFSLAILVVLTVFYILFSIFRLLYNKAVEQNRQSDELQQNQQINEQQNAQPDEVQSHSPVYDYIVGPVIQDPDHFVGREAEIDRFFTNLNKSQIHHLQVLGIRRAGKTSFLRYVSHPKIVRQKARDGVLVVYINLQRKIRKVADFYLKLAKGVNHCLPKEVRIPIPRRGLPNTDAFEQWLESPVLTDYRLIILLDEFEALHQNQAFDVDFFKELRSLADNNSIPLAWVTSSYIDLFRLTRLEGDQEKTSPFFNIFDTEPIILAGLTPTEADELIKKPADSQGVRFSTEEILSIKQLAGGLPFFLQAAARAWFKAKQPSRKHLEIKAEVKQKFATAMNHHFNWYWQHFEKGERTLLTRIATQTETDWSAYRLPNDDLFVTHLLRYGIITSQEGDYPYRIAGEVFAEWIRNRAKMESGADSESKN